MTIPACLSAPSQLAAENPGPGDMASDDIFAQEGRRAIGELATLSPDFLIAGPQHSLACGPARRFLPAGRLATLAARAAAFFVASPEGPALLVGAIPYDREAADHLFQPAALLTHPAAMPPAPAGTVPVATVPGATVPAGMLPAPAGMPPALVTLPAAPRIRADPPARDYRAAVAEAVARIDRGEFSKIVLSRSLVLTGAQDFDAAMLLQQMRGDRLATVFSVPLAARKPGLPRRLIGATPELLLEKAGLRVVSHPLAGSAPRAADPAADHAAGAALLRSDKDRREHAIVAEMVLDTLAPFCAALAAPDGVTLSATARMWHLGTRIEGRLRDPETPCAQLLALLHPTPAICGLPRAAAQAALSELEPADRGFYAGAVGWLDANGDGCWYLALRCAEIAGNQARLYAGAGIVAGSDPAAEEAETAAKFMAMLSAFGQESTGNIGE